MPGVLSSLGGRYLDPGTQVATLLLFLETGSERQRGGRSLARLSLPPHPLTSSPAAPEAGALGPTDGRSGAPRRASEGGRAGLA